MDEKTKKVLLKVAKEIGIEVLKLLGSKMGQVANELQKEKQDLQTKWSDKEKNYKPFGTYDDLLERHTNGRYEIKKIKDKDNV